MRTQGTFKEVYTAAKHFYADADNLETTYGGCPMDPVVRHTVDGVWMLDSGIDGEPNADAECRLDDFDNWFYETYEDGDYTLTDEDESDFFESIKYDEDGCH